MRKWIRNHQITAFYIIVFGIAWAAWLPVIGSKLSMAIKWPIMTIGAFAPWISAMVVIRASDGRDGLIEWQRKNFRFRLRPIKYLTGAFFVPIGMAALAYGIYRLVGGRAGAHPQLGYPLVILFTALFVGGNEEPGWRGFMTPALIRKGYHPVTASCIVGAIWGVWHAPFLLSKPEVYIPGNHGYEPLIWFTLTTTGLAVIWTWAYSFSQSVVPVMLLHAGSNQCFGYLPGDTVAFHSFPVHRMIPEAVAIWICALAVILLTRGRLGVTPDATEKALHLQEPGCVLRADQALPISGPDHGALC